MKNMINNMIEKCNLVEYTNQAFWRNFYTYKEEEKDEFNKIFPHYNEKKLRLVYKFAEFEIIKGGVYLEKGIYINIRYDIIYEEKIIGFYKAVYNLNGEIEDDFFVLY